MLIEQLFSSGDGEGIKVEHNLNLPPAAMVIIFLTLLISILRMLKEIKG